MVCDPIGSSKAGVVVSTLRFAKLLEERGHHVIFLGARSKEHENKTYYNGIRIYCFRSLPVPKSGGWNLAFPTVGELKEIFSREKIDVVHIILPMSGAIMAIRAARALNIKIVAHSHSQPENLFADMPKIVRPLLYNLWNRWLTWVYGKSDMLIYPSEMARSLLEKLNNKNHPSVVISNGINLKEFRPVEIGDFCERFNIPVNTVKLLFVGRIFPEKSIDTLIRAVPYILKKHADTHVMIVGGGHLRPKLERLTEELKVAKNVSFLGLISDGDKILAYNASDIFVLPSLAELEGMVVLEAMACGKPIVISDAEMNASRYFVEDNGLLFKNRNPEDLAKQALKIIEDETMHKRFGEVSLEKSKNYDIEQSAKKLEQTYERVISER